MSFKGTVNKYRKYITQGITKNIGGTDGDAPIKVKGSINIKRVLIVRPNHRLGNLLLISPLVQDISNTFPGCTIDVFVKGGLTPIVFKNYPEIGRAIPLPKKPFKELLDYMKVWFKVKSNSYDLVINVVRGSSSGRIATALARAKYKIYGDEKPILLDKYDDYLHMAKFSVYNLRYYLSRLGLPENNLPVPLLDLRLSENELAEGKEILQGLIKNDGPTISIFTFATGTKKYDETWWVPFYNRLVTEFPDYNIVEVLPAENVSQINFKAPSYYSRDIREMAAFIANTKVFIGADSGIMHLASASLTPTVGLFGITKTALYRPYGNSNIAVNPKEQDNDSILKAVKKVIT